MKQISIDLFLKFEPLQGYKHEVIVINVFYVMQSYLYGKL